MTSQVMDLGLANTQAQRYDELSAHGTWRP